MGTPSMTNSGCVPPVIELTPLILKVIPLDNEPSVGIICTPQIMVFFLIFYRRRYTSVWG